MVLVDCKACWCRADGEPIRESGFQTEYFGGRSYARRVLYMAALVATRFNPQVNRFYQRLLSKGKAQDVALTECIRKLLSILNEMVRNGERWRTEAYSESK